MVGMSGMTLSSGSTSTLPSIWFDSLNTRTFAEINLFCTLQAPSPQPKKGRRKSGLKPKKREGKGDEFLLQNGKQVQQESSTCYDCVIKVNLKTPDVTVETEEQYKTKVGMVKPDLILICQDSQDCDSH